MRDIQKAIQYLGGSGSSMIMGTRAKVVTVNENRTCKVKFIENDFEVDNVRLQSVPGLSAGLLIKPKINSDVVLMWLDAKTPVIVLTGEADEIDLLGNNNGGIVLPQPLHNRIKEVEDKVNEILNKLKQVVVPLAPSGTYPLSTDFGTMAEISNKEQSDLENSNVKQ